MKRLGILCFAVLMLAGCTKEEIKVKRTVFAWDMVEETDKRLLEKYQIDTIFSDMNHYSAVPGYNTFLLAGDPSWGLDDMEKAAEEAKSKGADGILFDIESDYEALAANLERLDSSLPVYACIPFWLDEEIQEEIIKAVDGIVIMNYSKGHERANIEDEMRMADEYGKVLITAYELQPAGEYGLKEINTYKEEGLEAVEENYRQQFSGTDVGIAFHNLDMMRKLDK